MMSAPTPIACLQAAIVFSGRFAESPRLAGSVELLVMRVGDERHVAVFAGPGDLGKELERVRHVALDLPPFLLGQAAAADGERAQLVRGQEGLTVAVDVGERALGQV